MSLLRAVLDTNVVLAARKTKSQGSPNREVTDRWLAREFILLYSRDIALEYAEKLAAHGVPAEDTREFFAALRVLGERVTIVHFHVRHYPADADDIAFLLCALNGDASHLVTYDDDLQALREIYRISLTICEPLEFLQHLRAKAPTNGIS